MHKLVLAHININSIRNKLAFLTEFINGDVNILLISETKINETFPTAQFFISGFSSPYRLDRTEFGEFEGGLLLYVREDIPTKLVSPIGMEKYTDFECIFIEINLNKKKWLIVGTYNPCNSMIKNHLYVLSSFIDVLCVEYENFIIMGDFNAEPKEKELIEFCNSYCLKSLINEPTCYKNINNPKCIDLILTNRSRSFQNSDTLETGLSDFHKMTLTVMKTQFQKLPPKIIIYRDYKNYEHNQFNREFNDMLNQHNFHHISNDVFVELTMNLLDRHAPLKQKYIRANQGPFMTK